MKIENNAYPWRVAKNRHTNTDGSSWGWIDGAPGNVCWSNERGSNMTREQAERIVAEHNDWLEKQTPVGVRLLKAKEKAANISKKVAEAEAQTERLRATLRDAETAIATLEDEQAWQAAMRLERRLCVQACRDVAARYPADIFPEDGKSLDCKSARMARLTAANIELEITERSNA